MTTFDFEKAALIVIDLQKGVVNMPCAPNTARQVVRNSKKLIDLFLEKNGYITLVHVPRPDESYPIDWGEIVPQIDNDKAHHIIQKHQWGAFHETGLDIQLKKQGIKTIVLCGISTAYGVDTTAREASQHGYHQIFAIDAMTSQKTEEHDFVKTNIFPQLGNIYTTDEILNFAKKH